MKIHHYPAADSLRRVQTRQPRPTPPANRRRIAVHEAGHVVLMRWIGLPSPLATIAESEHGLSGAAHWPEQEFFAQLPERPIDESGSLAATAAAVWHAGIMAEMIAFELPWHGPIHYPNESDYQRANSMLCERFGNHPSGAHAYAQRVALHVLTSNWEEVEGIAAQLVDSGEWHQSQIAGEKK